MTGQSLQSLPLEERLKAYRSFADEALRQAALTKDLQVRTSLLTVAGTWRSLAADMEKVARRLEHHKRRNADQAQ